MAVKLRLTRKGKKKQPFYRIVASDSRSRRDGKYIEKIGHYNPLTNPAEVVIDEEKAFYWLKNGAIPSDTVENLFSKKGIMLKWHHIKQGHDEAKIEEEYKKWELLQLERQKREEALAAQAKRKEEPEAIEPEPDAEAEAEPAKAEVKPEAKPETESKTETKPVEDEAEKTQVEQEPSKPEITEAEPEETPKPEPEQADETDEDKK